MIIALIVCGYLAIAILVMVLSGVIDPFDMNDKDYDCLEPVYMALGLFWPFVIVVVAVYVPYLVANQIYKRVPKDCEQRVWFEEGPKNPQRRIEEGDGGENAAEMHR